MFVTECQNRTRYLNSIGSTICYKQIIKFIQDNERDFVSSISEFNSAISGTESVSLARPQSLSHTETARNIQKLVQLFATSA